VTRKIKTIDLLVPLERLGVDSAEDVRYLVHQLETLLVVMGRPRRRPRILAATETSDGGGRRHAASREPQGGPARELPRQDGSGTGRAPSPSPRLESAIQSLDAVNRQLRRKNDELRRITERLEQPGRPMEAERAGVIGRRVAILLAGGEYSAARLAVEQAIATGADAPPAELAWGETRLPQRLLEMLERHGLYRVADVLPLTDQEILSWPGMGLVQLRELDNELSRLGLRRHAAQLNLVG
jgi:hypothetical protein